jgi:ferrous iron transport protein A
MKPFSAKKVVVDSVQTLAQASVGCRLRIEAVKGQACQQLRDMGFCETMEVEKLSNGRNMVCTVCGTKLALSKKLADQITVCPV